MKIKFSTSGFTLIELLIGMTIFAIGITGIYALLQTTLSSANYARYEIVAAWLLREQMDLVVNMRESNIKNYIPWDSVQVESSTLRAFTWGTYVIENNFSNTNLIVDTIDGSIKKSPIYLKKIDTPASDLKWKWEQARLYFDDKNRYTHTNWKPTPYASYMIVTPLTISGSEIQKDNKNQWWIIDARVITKDGNKYYEYDAKTMITDWQK